MTAKPTVETEDWPNLTHESRQELLKEILAAGTDVTGKWLSQAAVETIRRLREERDQWQKQVAGSTPTVPG